jgi:hypothetical protein
MSKFFELAPVVFVCSLLFIVPIGVVVSCGQESTQYSIYKYVLFNPKQNAFHY